MAGRRTSPLEEKRELEKQLETAVRSRDQVTAIYYRQGTD
jgi:hypothetical protein